MNDLGSVLTSLIPLIAVIVPIIIIGIVVLVIVKKVRKATKEYLGMMPGETLKYIGDAAKEEAKMPKSITTMTPVYSPAINRDFPDIGYKSMEKMAENGLISILNAIESKSTAGLSLETFAQSAIDKVENRITDLNSTNQSEIYDHVKVHKIGIADYKKKEKEANCRFEISVEYNYARISDENKDKSPAPSLTQAAYSVSLAYKQDLHETTSSIVYSSNCPNCGAPVDASAAGKICPYCGSGFTVIADRLWLIQDYKLIK